MNIIRQFPEELSKRDIYKLTKTDGAAGLAKANGEIIKVAAWIQYEDVNSKGETVTIMAIKSEEGNVYAGSSRTFARKFLEAWDMLDGDLGEIQFVTGETKPDSNGKVKEFSTLKVL